MFNAVGVPKGYIPILNRIMLVVGELHRTPRSKDLPCHIFAGSLMTMIVLQTRRCEADICKHRDALETICRQLRVLSPDEMVENVSRVAASAKDIITLGCLQAWGEANMELLLRDRLGEPLIATVPHLYVHQRALGNVDSSPRMERLIDRFAKLMFWNGKPTNLKGCKESISSWVLDLQGRSLRRHEFQRNQFDKRKSAPSEMPLLKGILDNTTSHIDKDAVELTVAKLNLEYYEYLLLRTFVAAVDEWVKLKSNQSTENIALQLAMEVIGEREVQDLQSVLHIWTAILAQEDGLRELEGRVGAS